jgi:hypothetical protein
MNLFERVKGILLNPREEWTAIEREPGDVAYLFTNYVAILAAIPAVCGFIGNSLFGISTGFGTFRVPILAGLIGAVVAYLLTFAMIYIVSLLADLLAPTFGGQKNPENALKLITYSYTPAWVAGIVLLLPSLAFLFVLGIAYGVYIMWLGIPPLMRAPREKATVYTAAIIVVAIVIGLIVGAVQAAIMRI